MREKHHLICAIRATTAGLKFSHTNIFHLLAHRDWMNFMYDADWIHFIKATPVDFFSDDSIADIRYKTITYTVTYKR